MPLTRKTIASASCRGIGGRGYQTSQKRDLTLCADQECGAQWRTTDDDSKSSFEPPRNWAAIFLASDCLTKEGRTGGCGCEEISEGRKSFRLPFSRRRTGSRSGTDPIFLLASALSAFSDTVPEKGRRRHGEKIRQFCRKAVIKATHSFAPQCASLCVMVVTMMHHMRTNSVNNMVGTQKWRRVDRSATS